MQQNVGSYDRIARFVLGAVLLALGGVAVAGVVRLGAGASGLALAAVSVVLGSVLLTQRRHEAVG